MQVVAQGPTQEGVQGPIDARRPKRQRVGTNGDDEGSRLRAQMKGTEEGLRWTTNDGSDEGDGWLMAQSSREPYKQLVEQGEDHVEQLIVERSRGHALDTQNHRCRDQSWRCRF